MLSIDTKIKYLFQDTMKSKKKNISTISIVIIVMQ